MKTKIILLAVLFLPLFSSGQTSQVDQRSIDTLIRNMNIDEGGPTHFISEFSDTVALSPSSLDPRKTVIYDDGVYPFIYPGQGPGGNRCYYFAVPLVKVEVATLTIYFVRKNRSDEVHAILLPRKEGYLEFSFISSCGANINLEKIRDGIITFNWKK